MSERVGVLRIPLVESGTRMRGSDFKRLADAATACEAGSVSALVLESRVPGVFTTGADLDEAKEALDDPAGYVRMVNQAVKSLRNCAVPTVAAVNGPCVGIGFEICLNVDFVVAADSSWFWFPEMQFGLPPLSAAVTLSGSIGRQRALALILGAKRLPAASAREVDLVTDVVGAADFDAAVSELCSLLQSRDRDAVQDLLHVVRGASAADELEALAVTWFKKALGKAN